MVTYQVLWIWNLDIFVHFKLLVDNPLRVLDEVIVVVEFLLAVIWRVRLDLLHCLIEFLRLLNRNLNIQRLIGRNLHLGAPLVIEVLGLNLSLSEPTCYNRLSHVSKVSLEVR